MLPVSTLERVQRRNLAQFRAHGPIRAISVSCPAKAVHTHRPCLPCLGAHHQQVGKERCVLVPLGNGYLGAGMDNALPAPPPGDGMGAAQGGGGVAALICVGSGELILRIGGIVALDDATDGIVAEGAAMICPPDRLRDARFSAATRRWSVPAPGPWAVCIACAQPLGVELSRREVMCSPPGFSRVRGTGRRAATRWRAMPDCNSGA